MNLRCLRIFIAVVDYQSMNAASRALHIAQPSISQAIAEMEDYYNLKLFDRISKRLYLTDNGKKLLSYARYIVSTFDAMELDMKNSVDTPSIHLGATIVFSTCFLPEIVRRMQNGAERILPEITTTNTKTIEQMILNSELDLGIVEGSISHPNIIRRHLLTDQLCLVCSRNHKFYGRSITIQDLQDEPVISREDHSFLRNYLYQLAASHHVSFREFWRCSGNEAVLSAVRSGLGVALNSSILIADELKSGEFYSIPVEGINMTREFSLVYHKDKFLHRALRETIRFCTEYAAETVAREENTSRFLLP